MRTQRLNIHWHAVKTPTIGLLGMLILIQPALFFGAFYLHLAILICLNIIIVNGLAIINRSGQLSFCHGAFVGIGAYASVIVTQSFNLPFIVGLLVGIFGVALTAYLLGKLILRLRGVYFVLVTFCFGELFRLFLMENSGLTGGANGLMDIADIRLLGVTFESREAFYCLAATLALCSIYLFYSLFKTAKGQEIIAVGEHPDLAEANGLSIQKNQRFAFVLGSSMAGFAGILLAHYIGYISPESFAKHASIAFIIMLVIGGRTSILGPIIGAMIMTALPELFRGAVETQNILYGITLILILRFLPQGLASLLTSRRLKGGHYE